MLYTLIEPTAPSLCKLKEPISRSLDPPVVLAEGLDWLEALEDSTAGSWDILVFAALSNAFNASFALVDIASVETKFAMLKLRFDTLRSCRRSSVFSIEMESLLDVEDLLELSFDFCLSSAGFRFEVRFFGGLFSFDKSVEGLPRLSPSFLSLLATLSDATLNSGTSHEAFWSCLLFELDDEAFETLSKDRFERSKLPLETDPGSGTPKSRVGGVQILSFAGVADESGKFSV